MSKKMKKNKFPVQLPPYDVLKVVTTLTQSQGWGIDKLNVPATWIVTRGEGQVAMIIDTGCPNHSDLGDAIKTDESKSFLSYEKDIFDKNGHSTHCSGIVGARDNAIGMVGVAPESSIVACKALDKNGSGTNVSVNAGLRYAIEIKPSVISMSLGTSQYDAEMHQLVKQLYDMNIPIIAAAGNEGPYQDTVNYPAKFPEVISVAAFDSSGNIADFSSRGPQVDFSAPGVQIYSTWLNNGYAVLNGTSMATPFMTGLVCLLLAKHAKQEQLTGQNDCKTVDQIKEHLIKYADDKGVVGKDDIWGYGVVDPERLIYENGITPTTSSKPTTTVSPIQEPQKSWWQKLIEKIRNWFK